VREQHPAVEETAIRETIVDEMVGKDPAADATIPTSEPPPLKPGERRPDDPTV